MEHAPSRTVADGVGGDGRTTGSRPSPGRRLRDAVSPVPRASGYYARSWRRYLTRRGGDLPVVRPTVALAGQALLDEVVLAGFRLIRPSGDARTIARVEQETIAAADLYRDAGWLDHPEAFLPAPPPLTDATIRTVRGRRHRYERLSFESGYSPFDHEPGRGRWLGYTHNRRARVWMMRHDEPRPWLVCVHGAAMGRPDLDLSLFRARWLHEDLGLNVALPVLPLHGPRGRDKPGEAMFPGEDVLDNVHGAAQAVWDIRRLLSWIRVQDGAARVGVHGISLGGYVTSLVASLDEDLACAIVGVPAVDLVDLIEQHAGLPPTEERRRAVRLAKLVGRVVSPLALAPRVAHEGRFIYAGLADRLVHPHRQVVTLWEHWGRPEIEWYEGGHTGFFRAKPIGRFVRGALERAGLVSPPAS